ncbi:7947_t:CDS:2, partial [Cetraspora pellucida]
RSFLQEISKDLPHSDTSSEIEEIPSLTFGKADAKKLKELLKIPIALCTAQNKIVAEIKKLLLSGTSINVIKRRIATALKIYDIFSTIDNKSKFRIERESSNIWTDFDVLQSNDPKGFNSVGSGAIISLRGGAIVSLGGGSIVSLGGSSIISLGGGAIFSTHFTVLIKKYNFHENYSSLLTQLSPSLIKAGWNQLTTRKKNPLSEREASSISSIIEAFLKHEVDRYQRNKKSQYNPTIESRISDSSPNSLLHRPEELYSEEEINARIKEATDNLHQEFIKSTEETLKTIKQQKDIECNQIKIDMANWSTKLFELSLKKYIQDGTIYNFIHALEEKDCKSYSNISWKK